MHQQQESSHKLITGLEILPGWRLQIFGSDSHLETQVGWSLTDPLPKHSTCWRCYLHWGVHESSTRHLSVLCRGPGELLSAASLTTYSVSGEEHWHWLLPECHTLYVIVVIKNVWRLLASNTERLASPTDSPTSILLSVNEQCPYLKEKHCNFLGKPMVVTIALSR